MEIMVRTACIVFIVCCYCFPLSTQAQESDPQKLLMDSISFEKLDVSGVRTALEKGANPNWVSGKNSVIGYLAMVGSWAKDDRAEEKTVEILQMLFRAGAKLQSCDQKILYFPVAKDHTLFTEVLLKNGANPTKEIEGWTPMEIAVSHGQTKTVELLRKYSVPMLENRIAIQLRLIKAAGDDNIPLMEEAIRNGADVNGRNRQGVTALIEALHLPEFTLEKYATVRYLFQKGADPKVQSEQDGFAKTTVLHLAIFNSYFIFDKNMEGGRLADSLIYARLIIESLLQNGALVSARDSGGMTPLHIAAQRNNIVGAKMLMEAGSKVMPRDDKGKTPLDYAESAEMIKLLKDHGAKEE